MHFSSVLLRYYQALGWLYIEVREPCILPNYPLTLKHTTTCLNLQAHMALKAGIYVINNIAHNAVLTASAKFTEEGGPVTGEPEVIPPRNQQVLFFFFGFCLTSLNESSSGLSYLQGRKECLENTPSLLIRRLWREISFSLK